MPEYRAKITWRRSSADFTYQTYNRAHDWQFAATTVPASAAPEYRGEASRVNPEEALVAALSSCHMLTFLAVAAKRKVSLDAYDDEPVGVLEKNAAGKLAITRVTLQPRIVWSAGVTVSADELAKMHHDAHEACFVASSVKTEVTVAPRT